MRHYDVAYVPQGTSVGYPAKPLQEMTLDEIKKKYIKMCAKANGNVSVCSKCPTPCTEGKRAIQLTANEVYNDPPIPLYGGKTLIEKAREENMLRRQKKEEEAKEQKREKQYIDNWYEDSLKSDDQVAWVMEKFNMTQTQAKNKIYAYRYHNGLTKPKAKQTIEASIPEGIESKMDALMKLQEKHKNIMIEMEQQYLKAKEKYEEISKKIDILCTAMDIINEQ